MPYWPRLRTGGGERGAAQQRLSVRMSERVQKARTVERQRVEVEEYGGERARRARVSRRVFGNDRQPLHVAGRIRLHEIPRATEERCVEYRNADGAIRRAVGNMYFVESSRTADLPILGNDQVVQFQCGSGTLQYDDAPRHLESFLCHVHAGARYSDDGRAHSGACT